MPQSSRHILRIATFGVLIAAFLLAACGRKGPLDLPPGDTIQQPGERQTSDGPSGSGAAPARRIAPPIEYGVDGRPLAPRGQKKKLPGDILID